jgi:D-alanine-D-alanine ligase
MTEFQSLRVGVLFGGRSGEHEVSLHSARNVMDALREAGHTVVPMGISRAGRWLIDGDPLALLTGAQEADVHEEETDGWDLLPGGQNGRQSPPEVDVVFPVLHGPYGEDGTVQGLLEMANLPYVGCGVLASAVAMDKDVAKKLFAQAGLPQTPHRTITREGWRKAPADTLTELEEALGYPVFVKPANLGSSVGISKADGRQALQAGLDLAAAYDRKLVVEAAVPNAREIEVSVLGNRTPQASVPGEIRPGHDFYDYEAKYVDDSSQLLIPAPLDEETAQRVREMAVQAFQAVDGEGLARVDFLLDDASGALYLNEINTMPGFTRISMYPKLWEASGVSYPALVDRLLKLALERHADRMENRTTR